MVSLHSIATVTIFLLLQQPWQTTCDDILAPFLSPIFDGHLCKGVECGKGSCKASENGTFGFECVCEPGWKQFRQGNDSSGFSFMPCVIPNCSLDYSCTEGSSVQPKDKQANASFLDPCHWADCGGGMCNKTSPITYKCECEEGHYNLLNVTSFPCFKQCALGMDCKNLGITVKNNSSPSSTVTSNNIHDSGQKIFMQSFSSIISHDQSYESKLYSFEEEQSELVTFIVEGDNLVKDTWTFYVLSFQFLRVFICFVNR